MKAAPFFFLLLLAGLPLFGQVTDEQLVEQYNQTALEYGKKSDFKNAILYRNKSLNILQLQTPAPYPELVSCFRNIGYYYRRWGKFSESKRYQLRAVDMAEKHLPEEHLQLARAYNGLGSYFYNIENYRQCYIYFNKALQLGEKYGHELTGNFYNNVGIAQQNLGEKDAALLTYQTALEYNENKFGKYHISVSDNHENIGTVYSNMGKPDHALNHLDTAEMILDSLYPHGGVMFASVYNNLGSVYINKGDFRQSLDYLEKGLRLYEKEYGSDYYALAHLYSNIGLLLMEKGDLDKSLAYFKRAYSLRLQKADEQKQSLGRTCLYIGKCYLEKKFYDESIEWLTKGIKLYEDIENIDPSELANARNDLGEYYEKVGNYKEALKQYNIALKINVRKWESNDPAVANSYAHIGQVYLLQKNYDEAENYFQKALRIRTNAYGNTHPDVADTYRLLALSCPKDSICINEYLAAAFSAQKYIPGETEFDQVPSLLVLLKTFQTRGRLLKNLFLENNNPELLTAADRGYRRSIELINFIKTSLEQPGSRLALQDNFYRIYEEAIWVKHQLFLQKNDVGYLHEAFKISEQSNAILLMEALQSVDAEKFAGIPDSLLELEHGLKVELAYLEKLRFEEELKKNGGDPIVISNINKGIFDIHEKYHDLLTELRKNHEVYFEMRYEPELVTAEKIQEKLLRPDQTMLAYFVGEEYVFVFVISKNQFELVPIKKEFPLEIWVEEFRHSIAQFNPAIKELAYLNQKYANIGHELYQLIFEPLKEKINTTSLVIVPGGMLGYLPFDALLATPPENYNDFSGHDYFIHHYQVSYSYSATLLEEMMEREHITEPFIAFAPKYYGDTLNVNRGDDPWRTVLGQLLHNEKEVLDIKEIMDGEVFLDSMATEEMFLEYAPTAGILHLATHGKSNDQHGEYSYLAFFQIMDSVENELLFVKNLYNMKIPAAMVVLSACETGIGELQRGEGIISLARGFSYAGAGSIITTMWNIDDKASSAIMVDFYKKLKKELPKDEALRKAKLEYLKKMKGGNRAHPLFWAGYVPVGDMVALEDNSFPVWGYILIVLVVCFLGYYIFKK